MGRAGARASFSSLFAGPQSCSGCARAGFHPPARVVLVAADVAAQPRRLPAAGRHNVRGVERRAELPVHAAQREMGVAEELRTRIERGISGGRDPRKGIYGKPRQAECIVLRNINGFLQRTDHSRVNPAPATEFVQIPPVLPTSGDIVPPGDIPVGPDGPTGLKGPSDTSGDIRQGPP
eukprot:gene1017-biopygen12026